MSDTKKRSAWYVFKKTICFVLLKLAINLTCIILSLLVLWVLFVSMNDRWGTAAILVLLGFWALLTYGLFPIADKFGGYLIRAGHIAVISEYAKTGTIPEHQVKHGLRKVKEKFPTTSVYFFVHNLVKNSVKDIQRLFIKTVDDISIFLHLSMIQSLASLFMNVWLGSVDDCCLGYTYINPKQGAAQSACDGVVLYAANWKEMMRCAASTMGLAVVMCIVLVVIPIAVAMIHMLSIEVLSVWSLAICLFAFYAATAVKKAVIDSLTVCRMVLKFSECAENTTLTSEYYSELKSVSVKFRHLCSAAKKENENRKSKKPN